MLIQIATVLSCALAIVFMTLSVISASAILKAKGYTKETLNRFLIRSGIGAVCSIAFIVLIKVQVYF